MAAASLAKGTVVGRYRVEQFLGAGGMGEVYRAWDESLGRAVALKILPPFLVRDPHRVQRFTTEARAASALSHPAIITMYEIGEDLLPGDDTPVHYISMELVEGVTLGEWIGDRPDLRSVLSLLAAVAEGLGKAHARGILHRDLKPDNIMVTADGRPKVLDFGVAKLLDPAPASGEPRPAASCRTLSGASPFLGTIGYMAPEQIEGFDLDHRADIFSFGCILYECITGRPPFLRATTAETLHGIVHLAPAPISLPDGAFGEWLGRVVERCLAKDREQRYDSAGDLARELLDLSQREAKSDGKRWPRLPHKKPRLKVVGGLSAVVLLLLLLYVPAVGVVASAADSISPSRRSEVKRLEESLAIERQQNENNLIAIRDREREIARRGAEIDRLRMERDDAEKLRRNIESSYRELLEDVSVNIRNSKSEQSELKTRLIAAKDELQRFRTETEERTIRQQRLEAVLRAVNPLIEGHIEARGLVFVVPGSFFRSGWTSISEENVNLLREVAKHLTSDPQLKILIEGHTDDNGSAEGNLELSQRRADTVARYLSVAGVDQSRITTIGRGESQPVASNESWDGREANRRVEMIVSY